MYLAVFSFEEFTQSQDEVTISPPIQPPNQIRAHQISDRLLIDGKLKEAEWKNVDSVSNFFQVQPLQGERANFINKQLKS